MFSKQIFSLHEAQRIARDVFDLELPTTETKLKSAFRAAAKNTHSDLNKSVSNDEFIKVRNSYEALINCSEYLIEVFQRSEVEILNSTTLKTIDGIPLSSLGLGLGPTTNGLPCKNCDSKGYRPMTSFKRTQCKDCSGVGQVMTDIPCRHCNGTGKFTQRNSRRVVDCRTCHGSGNFYTRSKYCKTCSGTGVRYGSSETREFETCHNCDGKGETPMFNPLFAKGRMVSKV